MYGGQARLRKEDAQLEGGTRELGREGLGLSRIVKEGYDFSALVSTWGSISGEVRSLRRTDTYSFKPLRKLILGY